MNPTIASPPGYLDLLQAAALLGIHPHSLRRLLRTGEGPPAQLVHGKYLFERAPLEQFANHYDPNPGRRPQWRRLI